MILKREKLNQPDKAKYQIYDAVRETIVNSPDEFVKYGQYEIRRMDKRLIEAGYITKAKIKWYGGGFAYPYLWKPDAVNDEVAAQLTVDKLLDNSDYCQSWRDPREKKEKEKLK